MNLSMAQCWSIATALVRGRTDYATSELSLYAHLALTEIASRFPHRPLESATTLSITSNATTYSLPTDFESVVALSHLTSVFPTRGKNLDQQDQTWIDSQSTARGTPECYALYGNVLQVWPNADSDMSMLLRYQATIATLTSSASTPGIGERYHYPWALKTAELLAASRNELEIEAMCRNRYLSVMGSTPSDQAHRQRDKGSMRVRIQRKPE